MASTTKSRITPQHVRDWRARMGFSLDEAADAIGMSRRQIIYYENPPVEDRPGRTWGIPKTVALAMEAIERRKKKGDPKETPPTLKPAVIFKFASLDDITEAGFISAGLHNGDPALVLSDDEDSPFAIARLPQPFYEWLEQEFIPQLRWMAAKSRDGQVH